MRCGDYVSISRLGAQHDQIGASLTGDTEDLLRAIAELHDAVRFTRKIAIRGSDFAKPFRAVFQCHLRIHGWVEILIIHDVQERESRLKLSSQGDRISRGRKRFLTQICGQENFLELHFLG